MRRSSYIHQTSITAEYYPFDVLQFNETEVKILIPKQPPDPPKHTILLRIIRMIFARNLQHSRESSSIRLHSITNPLSDMLINQQNSNILAARGELVECPFDRGVCCAGIDDEEVLFGRRGGFGFICVVAAAERICRVGGIVGGSGDVLDFLLG